MLIVAQTLQMVSQPSPEARLLNMSSRASTDQWLLLFIPEPGPAVICSVGAGAGDRGGLSLTDCISKATVRDHILHQYCW